MDMIIAHHWFTETGRRVVISLSFSTPSCFLMQPSVQLWHRAICICPASPTCLSHMCWPSVQCMCRSFSELPCSAWDFLDKGIGAVATCACTMLGVCDHTFGQRDGGWVQPQSTADFSCGSACLLWGVLLSVLVILSVLALISIWLTFQSPDILGKWLPSATATTWKVSEQILLLAQLSLHWSDLHCRGRGDLNFQCTTLVYQVKWAKESEVTECPCRLQAAEPSRLSLHTHYFKTHSLPSTLYQPLLCAYQQEEAC